ncbi:hypothetical protein ACLIA0_03300 [Bacillaceae bacterium W0354]
MVYRATTPKILSLFYFIAILIIIFFNRNLSKEFSIPLFILIPFATILFLIMFTNFKFAIENDTLRHEMFIWNIRIFKREVTPDRIQSINFKCIGWMKRCAQVKVKKGINMRIVNFEPVEVYDQLDEFASKHPHISVTKTNDYLLMKE